HSPCALFLYQHVRPPDLHAFPTRRSSDLLVRRRVDLPERRRPIRDLPVRADHEQVAVVEAVLRIDGAVRLADHAPGVAREQVLRSEEHTSELQSRVDLVCRLLLEKKNKTS